MEIDLSNKCRACLNEDDEMHHIFGEFDQGVTLLDILTSTTNFEISEDDGLSAFMCRNCTRIVVDFYNFKTIYKENERQIQALLMSSVEERDDSDPEASEQKQEKEEVEGEEEEEIYEEEEEEEEGEDEEKEECAGDVDQENSNESKQGGPKSYRELEFEIYSDTDGENDYVNLSTSHAINQPTGGESLNVPEDDSVYVSVRYNCLHCQDSFLCKEFVEQHLSNVHDAKILEYEAICEPYDRPSSPTSALVCKICTRICDSRNDLNDHAKVHMKNICDICGARFSRKSYLDDHKEVHGEEKHHVCNFCGKAYRRRTVLIKHRKIHTHPRQEICDICGRAFNDKSTLKTHIILVHVRSRNFMCTICHMRFPLKATLEKHVRRHQNKQKEFYCRECPLGYKDKSSLDRHVLVKHSEQAPKAVCDHCNKQYSTVSNLLKHKRTCHGQYRHVGGPFKLPSDSETVNDDNICEIEEHVEQS